MSVRDAGKSEIAKAFDLLVEDDPCAPAMICQGEATVSRAELRDRARDAAVIASRSGDFIALSAPPGPDFMSAFLGARMAGVCTALFDHALPAAALHRGASEMGARALWRPASAEPWHELYDARDDTPDGAIVKLTSGSTGPPKGVVVGDGALATDGRALIRALGLVPGDRTLCVLPLSHSYGLSVVALPLLQAGIPIVFPGDASPLTVAREHGATFLPSVPAWFRAMIRAEEPERWRGRLRTLLTAGAPLPPDLAAAVREHTGLGVHVLYGTSEVGAICFDSTGTAAERGTVGRPVDGVDVQLDPADGRVTVRSPAAGSGPWPPDTRWPFADGAFQAADRGSWRAGGELHLSGRVDRMLNVRGKKVNPDLVERALVGLPGVIEASVVGVELGNGQGIALRAVVAAEPGAFPSTLDLIRAATAVLAPHEVPRGAVLVEALPRTVRGKVDRGAVARIAGASS